MCPIYVSGNEILEKLKPYSSDWDLRTKLIMWGKTYNFFSILREEAWGNLFSSSPVSSSYDTGKNVPR